MLCLAVGSFVVPHQLQLQQRQHLRPYRQRGDACLAQATATAARNRRLRMQKAAPVLIAWWTRLGALESA